jgi:pimeloyl-ACP methyl ester carboxylesterase
MSRPVLVLVAALLLIFLGGFVAWRTQTAGGTVSVRDIRWVASTGKRMSGLLYVPQGVDAQHPAPGILAVHGYINSRETQDGFAIEFARRGYVVLALDQTGHGYSDPPAFGEGFGGPAGLAYLRSLAFVDTANIGLEGHSMGGWASGMAASADKDGYRAITLVGSSTGTLGVPRGTPEWPRNLAVIFSIWDEFSQTMWSTPIASKVGESPKLQAVFGVEEEVQPRKIYGSIDAGTARVLFQPTTNHPGDHLSHEAIGNAIEWFQLTLRGGNGLAPADQIWMRKEVGNLVSLVGMVLLFFPVTALLLRTEYFSDLRSNPAAAAGSGGVGWWVAAAITAFLGPLTFFRLKGLPDTIGWTAGPWFPQSITNGIVAWTTALGLISLLLFAVWHLLAGRKKQGPPDRYGLTWGGRVAWARLGKSVLVAFLVIGAGYMTLVLTAFFFTTDFRFWVFALKPMSTLQLRMALSYFPFFLFYFAILNTVLYAQLRRDDWGLGRAMLVNLAILVLGYVALYIFQYVPLLRGGTMSIASESLWTIISYQLLPLMSIIALLLTFLNRKTGSIYPGAFAAAMLVSWIVVASQATHVAL